MNNTAITWNHAVLDIEKYVYENGMAYRKDLPPASAAWAYDEGVVHALYFTCPCGCGSIVATPVRAAQNGWTWDGNLQEPTLTSPSIQILSPCRWHGYLKKGVFERC